MYVVILVTAKDTSEANAIAARLVEKKLIACANIVSGIQSIFWWEGKVDQSNEVLLVLKSEQKLVNKIIKEVKALHSYSVPEIIALPIIAGSKDYLNWIKKSVRRS